MKPSYILNISGAVIGLLGIISLLMSTSIFFNLFGIREKEGNYVLFIVIANFVCSFLYLFAAWGFFTGKPWTTRVLTWAALLLVIAFLGFGIYIYSGGIYEFKTIKAMTFRTLLTIAFAGLSFRYISKKQDSQ